MSFAPDTERLVNELIQAEYKNACEQAKKEFNDNYEDRYHSLYEGYAILKEEVEEAQHYFENVQIGLHNLWIAIKENKEKNVLGEQDEMFFDTKETIKELAQVCTVLMKIKNTLEKGKDTDVLTKRKVCTMYCAYIHRENGYGKCTCWGQKNEPYVELGDECPYQDKEEE